MPHVPLESVSISESSNSERTVIPFSPEDGALIVRCGGVERANGEYHWNTERRAWQKTGFIISPTSRTPDLIPLLWEGQGRWELCKCCNDGEGGGEHFDVLYFSVSTNENLPFMNGWRSMASEYLPPPVISVVEIHKDTNVLTDGREEFVSPPCANGEYSFQPLKCSYKGTADNTDETAPFIVLKRRAKPCRIKILEAKGTRCCPRRTAWNKSTEYFSKSCNTAVKKEEEDFLATEWALSMTSSTDVDKQISLRYGSIENSLEEARRTILNILEEVKRATDSIMSESEAETLLRIMSSLDTRHEGTPSSTPIMEAAVGMTNVNLEDNNNGSLWSTVETKEKLLLSSCSDGGKRLSRSEDANVELLAEEQLCMKATPPLSNDHQHSFTNSVPLPMWKWSLGNNISCALEDDRLPLFIDVLAFDATNVGIYKSESSSSIHPPSLSYIIRSTFQHHGSVTSYPDMDHSGLNDDLRALEDFVQLLQGLQWRSVVVRLDLKQLCMLHASLAVAIRDETHAHLPPFPNPYDLGPLEQMATDTSSLTLEGGAVRMAACETADLVQQYMSDILAFARTLPQSPERDAFTASLTLALCNPEGTVAAPVACFFHLGCCNDGSGEPSNTKHQEKLNDSEHLKGQNMRCAGCGTTLMCSSRHGLFSIASRKYDRCTMVDGMLFCRQFCHHGSRRIIPHSVIKFGDFRYHRVSDVAAKILDEIWTLPLLNLKLGPYLYDVKVSKTWQLRRHIVALCQSSKSSGKEGSDLEHSLSHVLGNRMHLCISDCLWSLEDLTGIQAGSLNDLLQNVVKELQLLMQPGIELDKLR